MKRLRSVLLIALLGCSDEPAGPITAAQLCANYLNADIVRNAHPPDEDLELLAHVLPGGFGGLVPTHFFLKDPAKADTARATAVTLASCDGVYNQYLPFFATASVRQGKYDWIELRRWYLALQAAPVLLWHVSDMDESENRLEFEFQTQAALDQFRAMARGLGVPDDALSLTISGPIILERLRAKASQ